MSCEGKVYIPAGETDCCDGGGAEKYLVTGTIPEYGTEKVATNVTVGAFLRAVENGNDIWLDLTDQGETVQVKVTQVGNEVGAEYVTHYADGTSYKTSLKGTLSGASGNALSLNVERYNLTNIDKLPTGAPADNDEAVVKYGESDGKPLFKKFSLKNLGDWLLKTFTTIIGGQSKTVVQAIEDIENSNPYLKRACDERLITIRDAQEGYLGSAVVSFSPTVDGTTRTISKPTLHLWVYNTDDEDGDDYYASPDAYGGTYNFVSGETKSTWHYEELPLNWTLVGDPVNNRQVFRKIVSLEAPTGDGIYTHGDWLFDPENPVKDGCYYDGTTLWLAISTMTGVTDEAKLNDYIVTMKDAGTPLAICYEVAETTSYGEGTRIPIVEDTNAFRFDTDTGTVARLCISYSFKAVSSCLQWVQDYSDTNHNVVINDVEHNKANMYATAEGYSTDADGEYSHAEGFYTKTVIRYSHAEGYYTIAGGKASHAEGEYSESNGWYSHAEGKSVATGNANYGHSEGNGTEVSNLAAHAEGEETKAEGRASHAEGYQTDAVGPYTHTEGSGTATNNTAGHAEGINTKAYGASAHSEGTETQATANYAHAEGLGTLASAVFAHAEGNATKAQATGSHAEGGETEVSATAAFAHVEGYKTSASGTYAHAEGTLTAANNVGAHAEGINNLASGQASHAEGVGNEASGYASHAGGYGTIAQGHSQTAIGKYNEAKGSPTTEPTDTDYAFIVGNGTGTTSRSNAFGILYNGSIVLADGTEITVDMLKALTNNANTTRY